MRIINQVVIRVSDEMFLVFLAFVVAMARNLTMYGVPRYQLPQASIDVLLREFKMLHQALRIAYGEARQGGE